MALVLGLGLACAACPEEGPSATPDEAISESPEREPAEPADPSAVPAKTARQLEALGYVPSVPTDNPDERGVTHAVPEEAGTGLSLFTSRIRASASLVDVDGEVVHRWQDSEPQPGGWMHVEPLPSGHLIAIVKDSNLVQHDWDSSLVWRTRIRAHHDIAVRDDGHVLTLVRAQRELRVDGIALRVLADSVAILSPRGEVIRTVDLLPLFRDAISPGRIARLKAAQGTRPPSELLRPGGVGDVMHTNAIEILDREIPGIAPAGSLLLSFRAFSRIAIVDADLQERLWIWGEGELDGQHDPTLLPNGHILVFDNGLRRGSRSRVLEVDPATGAVEWSYESPGFFTRLRGGAQALPNGNILVTESDSGRAFEITRSGERVWEFWNPDVVERGEETERGVIYRLNRYPASFFEPLRARRSGADGRDAVDPAGVAGE